MDQTLFLCVSDSAVLEELGSCAAAAGFRVEKRNTLPNLDEFEAVFPDILLIDVDFMGDGANAFLEDAFGRFPSVQTYIFAGTEYSEEVLFSRLKSGARGWIFKDSAPQVVRELSKLSEEKHFLKPFVAQLVLEEFRKSMEGEALLPVEEELLRQCARGVAISEIEKNLNLSAKMSQRHWEDVWQKLNINSRAQKEIAEPKHAPQVSAQPTSLSPPAPSSSPNVESKTESTAESRLTPHPEMLNLVTFRLGRAEFAFSLTELQEIQRLMPVTALPRVPSFVMGIANLRGTIVPIVDLRKKLNLDVLPLTKDARVILVNVENKLVGILVDCVNQVMQVQSAQLEAAPSLVISQGMKAIKNVVNIEERLVLLLDLKKLLLEDEEMKDSTFQLVTR